MTRPAAAFVLACLLWAGAASVAQAAEKQALDLPAGRLSDAVAVLGAQTGASIGVESGILWNRPVPAVKGRMSVDDALRKLLRGAGADAVAVAPHSWRIVVKRASARRRTPPPPAPIADSPDEGVPIVVTASKRDVRLRDFAGSVSILDGPDLAFGGEQGMGSVLSRLASLSSTHLGAGRNKLFIRGIADSSFTGPTQATVGQYLGDVRLTYNAPDPDLRLYDIQSVEVLEGPQGTLYGAGSLGGIIRIIRNPARLDELSAAMSGGISATQHGDPGGDIGGVINLPLLRDTAALRVVGYGITEGGYIDDVWRNKKDVNRTLIAGGRATLRIDPGDGWTVDVGGVFQDNHGRDSQFADRDLPPLTRAGRIGGGFDADYALGEIVIGKTWDNLSFLSSTGYVRQNLDETYDATEKDGPARQFRQSNRTRMFVSENRLWRPMRNGFGWVLGASYTRNRTNLSRALGLVDDIVPLTGVTNRIREATAYGEASVEPLRGLNLTAGLRYTRATLTGAGDDVQPAFSPAIEFARAAVVADRREETLLPSTSVSMAVLPGTLFYARYQQGFRPGGLAIESDFVRRFHNDRVDTMEMGFRHGTRGRDRFDMSVSLSYTRWRNIQADFIDAAGLPSTDNIGDGRIYSLSAAAGWRPLPGLSLDAAATYNDSRVTDPSATFAAALVRVAAAADAAAAASPAVPISASALPNQTGRIPNVARFTARIGADYRTPLGDDIDLRVGAWARYIGKSRLGIGPVLGEKQGDYLDTALTARVGRPGFGVTIGVTNLIDTIGNRFALGTPFDTGSGGQITPLRPRTIRLGIDTAF